MTGGHWVVAGGDQLIEGRQYGAIVDLDGDVGTALYSSQRQGSRVAPRRRGEDENLGSMRFESAAVLPHPLRSSLIGARRGICESLAGGPPVRRYSSLDVDVGHALYSNQR